MRLHEVILLNYLGRAIANAVSHWFPPAEARARVRSYGILWWIKWHWGRFFLSTSVSAANSHYTDCSTLIIYHTGLVQ
jgi:hypothetical protein